MKLISLISFLICLIIVIDGRCPVPDISDCNPISCYSCVTRSSQGEKWITARGEAFFDPTVLSKHFIADIINDNKKIYKYRIRWFSGSYSGWYFPGQNDNDWTAKSNYDNVWNQAQKDAGRRQWTMFADHYHEVCYLPSTTLTAASARTDERMTDEQEFDISDVDSNEKRKTILISFFSGALCMFVFGGFCLCGYIRWKKSRRIKHVVVSVEESDEFVMEDETNMCSENQI
eukprot:UN04936